MLAVFAEFERDILRGHIKAGIVQARKEGKHKGGRLPPRCPC
jgi:DNA invertase Pin-like site-specific DNA recombinase